MTDANEAINALMQEHKELCRWVKGLEYSHYKEAAEIIQSLQADLNTSKSRGLELQAENDRLRKVEEKARAVVETMVCQNMELDEDERKCYRIIDCVDCELKQLEDALKGGADENRTDKTD